MSNKIIIVTILLIILNVIPARAAEYPENLIKYDKNTWIEWSTSANVIKDLGGMLLILDMGWVVADIPVNGKPNTKYGLLVDCTYNNLVTNKLYLGDGGINPQPWYILFQPGVTGLKKYVFTTNQTIAGNKLRLQNSEQTEDDVYINIRNFRLFELPAGSEIENDFNVMTAAALDVKYPFDIPVESEDNKMLQYIAVQIYFILGFLLVALVLKLKRSVPK